jgi:hypothetical protein
MTETSQTCGKAKITYDSHCTWTCVCIPGQACTWTVACADSTTSGTGFGDGGHSKPSVSAVGNLSLVAEVLAKAWQRPVNVPPKLAHKSVELTVTGTQEEIARALGLHLGRLNMEAAHVTNAGGDVAELLARDDVPKGAPAAPR